MKTFPPTFRLAVLMLAVLPNLPAHAEEAKPPAAPLPKAVAAPSGAHDFDFFRGYWRVQNRKRVKILQGVDEWKTFEATVHCGPLPGGVGNVDYYAAPKWRPGYVGVTIRVFNPVTGLWSLFWLNNKGAGVTKEGQLDTPVVGRFENGVGTFEGDDVFDGRPIRVRYRWSEITPDRALWEQAFSPDGGRTWETNWEMVETRVPETTMGVFELRQYTLHPGQRDVLVELFEREFLTGQEAAGARLLGQFRDQARPDRFVWLRGFTDMKARHSALDAFYRGPVWKAHSQAANATMIDSNDVLLLRPLTEAAGFPRSEFLRPPLDLVPRTGARVVATIAHCQNPIDDAFAKSVAGPLQSAVAAGGAKPFAWMRTEPAENNFPALPVRTGEHVIVWFQRFDTPAQTKQHLDSAAARDRAIQAVLGSNLKRPLERLVLEPTSGSQLY